MPDFYCMILPQKPSAVLTVVAGSQVEAVSVLVYFPEILQIF